MKFFKFSFLFVDKRFKLFTSDLYNLSSLEFSPCQIDVPLDTFAPLCGFPKCGLLTIHKCCDVVDDELSNLSLLLIFQWG